MPHSRATGHPPSPPNLLHEPVNSLASMIQRTKRAIPRRTTPGEQIAFLAPILQQLQQQEANSTPTSTSTNTNTSSRPTSIYFDNQLHFDNIYEPAQLPPLQRIPIRDFFNAWVIAVGQRKAWDTGKKEREREMKERGPWAPALNAERSEVQHPDPDPDCTWMRNFDPRTPVKPVPVSLSMPNPGAVARNEALLFSRWLRASAMSTTTSTGTSTSTYVSDAMATVVYASSPLASSSTRMATALWRVLLRLTYELLRHLPRHDMLFPHRERRRLSRDAFRRFLALAGFICTSTTPVAAEQEEDALEAGIAILEALAGLTDRENDERDEGEHGGHGGERGAEVDAAEHELIRMARENRQVWKKRRQQPLVLIVDLTEVPAETQREANQYNHLSGLMPPRPPSRHYSDRAPMLYQRFVEALEAFTKRNRAALFVVGGDGVCRMRVALR